MFLGRHEYKIDQKGRVPFPPKFREELRQGLVMSQGLDGCINVYPLSEWQKMSENLATLLPPTRNKARRMRRFTFATAFPAELDAQGRAALPLPLRQYAEIGEAVIIAGVGNYIEIWSKEKWEAESDLMKDQAAEISESIEERY
jgi:MraZ protein